MAVAAFWLAFYLVPFLLLVLMPGWRSRAAALLVLLLGVAWSLLQLRGIETMAFGVWATALLAALAGMAGAMIAWLAQPALSRFVGWRQRLLAAAVGGVLGPAFVPLLMPALRALFARW